MISQQRTETVRVYKYRWIILFVFSLYAAVSFGQNLQYTIIANITAKYYDVDSAMVNVTSLVFMICFLVFCFPTNYVVERYNLKVAIILSSGLTACGNLIKLLSVSNDRLYVVFIGQTLCAIGQVVVFTVPSKVANTWFGPGEVSTACALAVLGPHIGISAGSMFSANFVTNSEDVDAIGREFWALMVVNASITVFVFALVLIFFRAKPPTPPSQSQFDILDNEQPSTLEILKAMAKNKNYLLVLLAFGGSNAIYTSFGILLSTVYLHYFPGFETEVGVLVAMTIISGGCIGNVFFGYILDKYHHFKMTSFFIIFTSSITYIFVVLSMELHFRIWTYFTLPFFGFFIASTLIVGIEFATEVAYPIPEAAITGVFNATIYLFAIIYTLACNSLMDVVGYVPIHAFICVLLVLYSVVIYFITPNLRRREANTKD